MATCLVLLNFMVWYAVPAERQSMLISGALNCRMEGNIVMVGDSRLETYQKSHIGYR